MTDSKENCKGDLKNERVKTFLLPRFDVGKLSGKRLNSWLQIYLVHED